VSAVSYAVAPAGEALAAVVAISAAKPGHQAIEGRVQGAAVTLRLVKTEDGRNVTVGNVRVGDGGRFHLPVGAGAYKLIIHRGNMKAVESLTVRSGKSEFVVVKVSKTGGLVGIAPVVFNY
jgi:hypothetical protein